MDFSMTMSSGEPQAAITVTADGTMRSLTSVATNVQNIISPTISRGITAVNLKACNKVPLTFAAAEDLSTVSISSNNRNSICNTANVRVLVDSVSSSDQDFDVIATDLSSTAAHLNTPQNLSANTMRGYTEQMVTTVGHSTRCVTPMTTYSEIKYLPVSLPQSSNFIGLSSLVRQTSVDVDDLSMQETKGLEIRNLPQQILGQPHIVSFNQQLNYKPEHHTITIDSLNLSHQMKQPQNLLPKTALIEPKQVVQPQHAQYIIPDQATVSLSHNYPTGSTSMVSARSQQTIESSAPTIHLQLTNVSAEDNSSVSVLAEQQTMQFAAVAAAIGLSAPNSASNVSSTQQAGQLHLQHPQNVTYIPVSDCNASTIKALSLDDVGVADHLQVSENDSDFEEEFENKDFISNLSLSNKEIVPSVNSMPVPSSSENNDVLDMQLDAASAMHIIKNTNRNCASRTCSASARSLKEFKCYDCNIEFKNSTQLKNHSWRHTGQKPYTCEICQSTFTQHSNLKTHQRIHTGERPFSCLECPATFTQISNLRTHQKIHTGEKPFKCDICDTRFSQMSNLKSHKLIHTGERPYKCEQCGADFIQSSHLKNHKRIHTDERPFPCNKCNARFRQLSNLKTHQKTHTGERPYVCEVCGTAFAQKSNLKSHKVKIHSFSFPSGAYSVPRKKPTIANKSCVCPECGAKFSMTSNLTIHMRIHTGEKPYACIECGSAFAQKSNLKSHMLTHSQDRPHQCPQCSVAFKQKNNLKAHMLKKHPYFFTSTSVPTQSALGGNSDFSECKPKLESCKNVSDEDEKRCNRLKIPRASSVLENKNCSSPVTNKFETLTSVASFETTSHGDSISRPTEADCFTRTNVLKCRSNNNISLVSNSLNISDTEQPLHSIDSVSDSSSSANFHVNEANVPSISTKPCGDLRYKVVPQSLSHMVLGNQQVIKRETVTCVGMLRNESSSTSGYENTDDTFVSVSSRQTMSHLPPVSGNLNFPAAHSAVLSQKELSTSDTASNIVNNSINRNCSSRGHESSNLLPALSVPTSKHLVYSIESKHH